MFYLIEVEDYVRVEPKLFGLPTQEAVEKQLVETYKGFVNRDIGSVVSVVEVLNVGEGIIIPGDGAAYYNSRFKLIVWRPEMQELVFGSIDEITNFGAFINLGVMKGMIHISQTMEDYVSYNKSGTLAGKSGKKSLHKGDLCLARIVAVSYKAGEPKIGLTMRQPGLGKLEWIKADKKKQKSSEKAEEKEKKKEKKKK
ncbi:DNA-directed RNA polymerase [Candidatus Pacearchaeota archaeon]|nr:DNA-directed RNA polymerase [Candidatus Pacearchaeota archaeon]